MPRQLWTLCVCHLLTWFSIIAEAVFYTDFMGQVIYHGDPKVNAHVVQRCPDQHIIFYRLKNTSLFDMNTHRDNSIILFNN